MHYKDGTPAKLGDLVKHTSSYRDGQGDDAIDVKTTVVGQLLAASPGVTSCNGRIRPTLRVVESPLGRSVEEFEPGFNQHCVTIGECEKVV